MLTGKEFLFRMKHHKQMKTKQKIRLNKEKATLKEVNKTKVKV